MIIKQTIGGTMYRNNKGTIVWLAETIDKQFSVWEHDKPPTRMVFKDKCEAINYVCYLVNGEV